MKRIYEKSELTFSILWIIIYVAIMSLADYFSTLIGIEKIFTMLVSLMLAIILLVWVKKVKLSQKYGLIKGRYSQKTYLCFMPLVIIVSVNFWCGVCVRYNLLETILFFVSMLCVGIIEEIIFRGFLFNALRKKQFNFCDNYK